MMEKIRQFIYRVIKILNIVVMFSMFALLIMQVVTRKILNDPLTWPEEVSLVAIIWITFFGAYQCTVEGIHLKMDFLQDKLNNPSRKLIEVISKGIVVWFLLVTCYWGFHFIQSAGATKMPVSGLPMWVPYWIIWSSFFMMAIDYLLQIFLDIQSFFGNKNRKEGDEKCSQS